MKLTPGANPNKKTFSSLPMIFFSFFAVKLCHFIVTAFFPIWIKHTSLTAKIVKQSLVGLAPVC